MTNLAKPTKAITEAVIDPVCGMTVAPGQTKLVTLYQGHSYWFCAEACRNAFEKNPDRYLGCRPAKSKNWFMRWLDQLAESNRKEFGGRPKCH